MPNRDRSVDERLQNLDVHVVDVLAHLEALLRHSHSVQRALLTLRAEAPPPMPAPTEKVVGTLNDHAHQMRRDCELLAEIIEDLIAGIGVLSAKAG